MKRVIIVPDGAADLPVTELDDRTPLEAAHTPNLDALARTGSVGLAQTIPPQAASPGSDIGLLSILGYDPLLYYTGRSPLEAASIGVSLDRTDAAYRCNLVASDGETLLDYSAGEVTTEEARPLVELIDRRLGSSQRRFFAGISYRHLMVWRDGPVEVRTTPPHDIQGQPLEPHLPQGDGEAALRSLVYDSLDLLDGHEVNRQRRDKGRLPANMIWPWGQGRAPSLPSFVVRWGTAGVVIGAVDLIRGIARYAGLSTPSVTGATGDLHTDFAAKGEAAVEALRTVDFVMVHVEASDEAGHQGDPEKKVWAIEQVDSCVVGPVRRELEGEPAKILILPDHRTPLSIRTHSRDAVPFVLWPGTRHADRLTERDAAETGLVVDEGHRLIEMLFE